MEITKEPNHKIIHFVYGLWSNTEMPIIYQSNVELWKILNPDYVIRIWNREAVENLVEKCKKWQSLYQEAKTPIQRSDIARLIIVWRFGGIYSDLDVCPKESLHILGIIRSLKRGRAVVGIEHPYSKDKIIKAIGNSKQKVTIVLSDKRPLKSRQRSSPDGNLPPIRNGVMERLPRISNYWFAAPPRHPLIRNCLNLIVSRIHLSIQSEYDILYTTGPDVLSEAFNITPKSETRVIDYKMFTRTLKHFATGTWRWNKKSQTNASEPEVLSNDKT
jgi:hypothetical protein